MGRIHGRIRHGDARDVLADTAGQLVRIIQLADQDHLAASMFQHVGDLLRRLQRVQRHADQPGMLDGQVADEPLGAVLRQQRHPITGCAAQGQQGAGQAPRLLIDLAPGEVVPLTVDRLAQPDAIRLCGQPVIEALQGQLFGHRTLSCFYWSRVRSSKTLNRLGSVRNELNDPSARRH